MSEIDDYTLPNSPPQIEDKEFPKGLPGSLDAERTILGAILLDNRAFNEAAESLLIEDFAHGAHQRIYARMEELIDASVAVDLVTLAEEMARHKEIEAVGGVAYLSSLTEGLPRNLAIDDYVRIVKQKSQLRRVIHLASNAITRAADQTEMPLPIIEDMEASILEIAQESQVRKLRSMADAVQAAGGIDTFVASMTEPAKKQGLMTGFIDFDRMTGGFHKQELIIIAARPSQGKSALAINISQNVAHEGENVVAIFSLEMSEESLHRRMVASEARVDVRRASLDGEFLSAEERDKMFHALGRLMEMRIHIDDSPLLTPIQLRAKARRLKQREKRLDLIVIDYAQLLSGGARYGNRQEEMSAVSRSLKACAKELDVPVLALAQINRKNEERSDKRPILSDLRESGAWEQDADVVAFVHRDEYYQRDNEDVRGLADLIIAKQRNGPTGNIKLAYMAEFTMFGNLARGM